MRKLQWFLIVLDIFFFCLAFPSSLLAQENLQATIKKVEPSTVFIKTYDKEGKALSQGSGFFISKDGDIITNRHVLKGASSAEVKIAKGKVYPIMKIIAEDKEGDIIMATVNITPKKDIPSLTISNSIPELGERVLVIGNPLGLERTVSDGIVSAVRDIPGFGKIIQITAPLSPGSSGSPVVNMKGEVIGIATFQVIEGQNLNFAIPGERIAKLKPVKKKTLAEWEARRTEELRDSAEELVPSGLAFFWIEDYEKALSYFEKAVKKDSRNADAFLLIGNCKFFLARYTEAVEAFKHAISIKPDYAEAYFALGLSYDSLERFTEAIEAYKHAIRIKSEYAEAHSFLGRNYYRLKRYAEALEASKHVVRIKPDDAEEHLRLGASYAHLERFTEAIEALKQAIRIKPEYAEAHFVLGGTYLLAGDKGSALDEYKILKELDKDLANKLFNRIYK